MWPPWPHIAVIVYYTYKLLYFNLGSGWRHIFMASIFLFMGLTPSRVTQKLQYSNSVCQKKYLSILHLSTFSFSLLSVNSNFCIWYVQSPLVMINRLYIYARINSNTWNKSFIFCCKMSGEFPTPIGRRLYRYFNNGIIILHKLLAFLISRVWSYPIFKSSDVTYWKTSNFNNISLIFGIGFFRFNCLFKFLNSLSKSALFDLGLCRAKYGYPHSELFSTSRTPSKTRRSTSF